MTAPKPYRMEYLYTLWDKKDGWSDQRYSMAIILENMLWILFPGTKADKVVVTWKRMEYWRT